MSDKPNRPKSVEVRPNAPTTFKDVQWLINQNEVLKAPRLDRAIRKIVSEELTWIQDELERAKRAKSVRAKLGQLFKRERKLGKSLAHAAPYGQPVDNAGQKGPKTTEGGR